MTLRPEAGGRALRGRGGQAWARLIRGVLFACAAGSVVGTLGIVVLLAGESLAFFASVPPRDFLLGRQWAPGFEDALYGVLPLVTGSALTASVALVLAVPLGLLSAVYLEEYAGPRIAVVLRVALDGLAAVPTVVYGFCALFIVSPAVQRLWPAAGPFNALSAGIAVGVMILPTLSVQSRAALAAVPDRLRLGALALGATRYEVLVRVVLPAAAVGLVSATLVAFGRAIGETMIVTMVAGSLPQVTANPLEPVQTLTAYVIDILSGDVAPDSVEYRALFAVGSLLLLSTVVLRSGAAALVRARGEAQRP